MPPCVCLVLGQLPSSSNLVIALAQLVCWEVPVKHLGRMLHVVQLSGRGMNIGRMCAELNNLLEAAPALVHVQLASCWQLQQLQMARHLHLAVLNVNACTTLEQLHVASPLLTALHARGCTSLTVRT